MSFAPDLVTGEAVALDLRLAKLPSRSLAFLLDFCLQVTALILGIIGVTAIITAADLDEAASTALVILTLVGILVGYPCMMETLSGGRTLGKMALGLRIVRADGGPIRFRHALVRALCGFVELWMTGGCIAVIVSLINPRGQRVGDLLAGTVAVAERQHLRQAPAVVAMPPGLQGWASTLDLSALNETDASAARSLVQRWHQLAPASRESMAAELTGRINSRVSPPPPAGTPPIAYLSAVLAERLRRTPAPMPTAPPAPAPVPPAPTGPLVYGQPQADPYYDSPAQPPTLDQPPLQPEPASQPEPNHGWRLS